MRMTSERLVLTLFAFLGFWLLNAVSAASLPILAAVEGRPSTPIPSCRFRVLSSASKPTWSAPTGGTSSPRAKCERTPRADLQLDSSTRKSYSGTLPEISALAIGPLPGAEWTSQDREVVYAVTGADVIYRFDSNLRPDQRIELVAP